MALYGIKENKSLGEISGTYIFQNGPVDVDSNSYFKITHDFKKNKAYIVNIRGKVTFTAASGVPYITMYPTLAIENSLYESGKIHGNDMRINPVSDANTGTDLKFNETFIVYRTDKDFSFLSYDWYARRSDGQTSPTSMKQVSATVYELP